MAERRIAEIEEHKVKTGETLKSVAEANGMTWQQLTEFNWNTSVPDQVNVHLRDEVGCRKKTADGKNYVFDNADEPGVIYVPKKWSQSGLMTDQTHTIRVRRLAYEKAPRVIRLFDWKGKAMPGAPYAVCLGQSEITRGKADGDGDITLPDVLADRCIVKWATPGPDPTAPPSDEHDPVQPYDSGADAEFQYANEIFLDADAGGASKESGGDEALRRRLHNLGYSLGETLAEKVRAFQRDLGAAMTGITGEAKPSAEDHHDEKYLPPGEKSA